MVKSKTHYTKVEELLQKSLLLLSAIFSQSEEKEVQDFVDAGEYGVALETICFIVQEENKQISQELFELIKQLATLMNLDETTWESINSHVEAG